MDPTPALIGSAVALFLVLVAVFARGEEGKHVVGRIAAALAPFAASAATFVAVGYSLEAWPPTFQGRLLTLALGASVLGVVASFPGFGRIAGVTGVAALAFVLFRYCTESLHESDWAGDVVVYAGCWTGAAVLLQVVRATGEASGRAIETSLAVAIAALAASPIVGWTGASSSAFLLAAVSASAGLFGILAYLVPKTRKGEARWLGAALAPAQSLLLVGLVANGVFFASTRLEVAAMAVLAPLVTLLPGQSWKMSIARLALVAAIAGGGVALEKVHRDAQPANPYADAYGD